MLERQKILNRWIGEAWTSQSLRENLYELTMTIGPRLAGTESEARAAHFIERQFEQIGVEKVELDPFKFRGWKKAACQLSVKDEDFPATPLAFSPPSQITAPMVFLDVGMGDVYEGADVRGKIVMVTSATPPGMSRMAHRIDKYNLAVDHGASGFLFMSHYPGLLAEAGAVRFGEFGAIPGIALSLEAGQQLRHHTRQGAEVMMRIEAEVETLTSQNILGWIDPKSHQASERPVLIGAHYDSLSPGAIDNAVAVSILIHLAQVLNDLRPFLERPVILTAFGAEDIGLFGSRHLVQEKWVDDLRMMINMDGIGSHPELQFNTQGFDGLKDLLVRTSRDLGIEIDFTNFPWPYTDHWPFTQKGIPSFQIRPRKRDLGRGWGHTPADTLDKVTSFNLKANAAVITQFVTHLLLMENLDVKSNGEGRFV